MKPAAKQIQRSAQTVSCTEVTEADHLYVSEDETELNETKGRVGANDNWWLGHCTASFLVDARTPFVPFRRMCRSSHDIFTAGPVSRGGSDLIVQPLQTFSKLH